MSKSEKVKGQVVKFVKTKAYGWIEADRIEYHFNLKRGALADRTQMDLVAEGKQVEFVIEEREAGERPSVKLGTLRILDEAPSAGEKLDAKNPAPIVTPRSATTPTISTATPPAPPAPPVPPAKPGVLPFSFEHEVIPGYVKLVVNLGRVADGVLLYVANELYTPGPKPKKGETVPYSLTDSKGIAIFVVQLTAEQEEKGALPMCVVLERGGFYNVSWFREQTQTAGTQETTATPVSPAPPVPKQSATEKDPDEVAPGMFIDQDLLEAWAGKQPMKREVADHVEPELVESPIAEPILSIRDVTAEDQQGFMTLEIIHTVSNAPVPSKLTFSAKKKSELAIRERADIVWEIGTTLAVNSEGKTLLDVRIKHLASGEFGGDYLVVTADSGKTANFYIPAAFVVKPTSVNDTATETIH